MALSILWLTFYYGWFASEIYIAIKTRTRRSSGNVRDRGTMLMLWVVMILSISLGTWYGAVNRPNIPRGFEIAGVSWLWMTSLIILVAGVLLRWSAVLSLGKAFSANVAIVDSQQVMKTGLYRWMRHPSYTGLLMCILAVGLHPRNWVALLIVLVPPTAVLLYRIHIEEIALREHFGEEYQKYSAETKRLVPGIY